MHSEPPAMPCLSKEHILPLVNDVTGQLIARHASMLASYGRRNPDSQIVVWKTVFIDGVRGVDERLNRDAVLSEVMVYVSELLAGNIPAQIAKAMRNNNVEEFQILLLNKCRSYFSDRGRDPRFKAIRSILHKASVEGKLLYKPGKGMFGKARDQADESERAGQSQWACFAFGTDPGLDIIPHDLLSRERYADWPLPPRVGVLPDDAEEETSLTQKAMVLAAAGSFWEEVRRRHGAYWVFVRELQRYLQAVLPPWQLDALLPDPCGLSAVHVPVYNDPDGNQPDWDSGETSVQGENSMLLAEYDRNTYQPAVDMLPMQDVAQKMAQDWFDELDDKRALLFCLMFHCQSGSTKAAKHLGYNSPQNADSAYKTITKHFMTFCSLREGVTKEDLDVELFSLFVARLHDCCEDNVLRGCCP